MEQMEIQEEPIKEEEKEGQTSIDGELADRIYGYGYENGRWSGLLDGSTTGHKQGYDRGYKIGKEMGTFNGIFIGMALTVVGTGLGVAWGILEPKAKKAIADFKQKRYLKKHPK